MSTDSKDLVEEFENDKQFSYKMNEIKAQFEDLISYLKKDTKNVKNNDVFSAIFHCLNRKY